MLDEDKLREILLQLSPQGGHGPYYRAVALHHLVPTPGVNVGGGRGKPLWSLGSKQFGGRFTTRNVIEAVYLAEDHVTALAEVTAIFKSGQGGVISLKSHPWVVVTLQGILLSVLDVTNTAVVAKLGSSHQELTGEWRYTQEQGGEAPTQRLGRVCHSTGLFDAIRYPSSKSPFQAACVAVFPDRLKGAAFLEVYDPNNLLVQRLP